MSTEPEYMSRTDRERWQAARTLTDVGNLMADWIQGKITTRPGYYGPTDLDQPDTLVPLLASLCRDGFVTHQSQEGFSGWGYDGAWWVQHAFVEAFTTEDVVDRLYETASSRLIVISHDPATLPAWRYRRDSDFTATYRIGRPYTGAGSSLPRRHIRDPHIGFGACGKEATDALCSAWQVTVADLAPGPETFLWDFLSGLDLEPGE
jgi:hypothetical protein